MKKLILVFTVILSAGCVTTQVTSNKAPGFTEKIDRLYVMVRGSDSAKPFFTSFTNALSLSLKSKGIETEYYYFDPLSLDSDEDIMKKVDEFEANILMVINQTESRNVSGQWGLITTNTGGTFNIRLFEPTSDSPIWRAKLEADASFGLTESAKNASKKLIQKLEVDNLL